MTERATGTFEVKLNPHTPYDSADGVSLGRVSIAKQFRGDLDASSTVEMLAARTPVPESAGYVAIERVSGRLRGRAGSFVLQHSGTMRRGAQSLSVTVVPDSGTGELANIDGSMTIEIVDGVHRYELDYSLDRITTPA